MAYYLINLQLLSNNINLYTHKINEGNTKKDS